MDLFSLLGKIAVDNDDANKSIDETTSIAESSNSKISTAFSKIGSAATTMAKVGAVAIGAIATGIGTLTSLAVSYYADYEQLTGGVETLFGDSGEALIEYASNAYKTAGLSANNYMETVTSFSASLISSLGGDTEKAVEYANLAITDMSDNANKMGTDMESIQNAYQGFAKQNYTMLDNLKLGYGGTEAEMERLLEDASAISNIQYDISSYADIVSAIHVIQEEMGVAGATALEASTTISGSIGMMKSAWTNFLTGMADPEQDFDALLNNLVESVITVADLLIPRLASTLPRLVTGLMDLMSSLATYLPDILTELLPALLEGAAQLLMQLVVGIPDLLKTVIPVLIDSIKTIFTTAIGSAGLDSSLDEIFAKIFNSGVFTEGMALFQNIISTLSSKLGAVKTMFWALVDVIKPLAETYLVNFMQQLETMLVIWNDLILPCLSFVIDVFMQLVTVIANAVSPAINEISSKLQEFFVLINDMVQNVLVPMYAMFIAMLQNLWAENQDKLTLISEYVSVVFQRISDVVTFFVEAFKNYIYPFMQWICTIVMENMDIIQTVFQSVFDYIGGIIQFFTALFKGDWESMWEAVKTILSAGIDYIINILTLLGSIVGALLLPLENAITNAFENIKQSIVDKLTQAKDTIVLIFTAIKDAISEKIELAKTIVSTGIELLKNLFNFEWSLPELKLPHFSVSGSFSLNPLSTPSFDIEWYKDGGIMTQPTAFGINPSSGKVMVGGEAGDEAIAPIDTLQSYVSEAVQNQNEQLVSVLNLILMAVYNLDDGLADKLYDAFSSMKLQINEREFARLVRVV